jgi:GTPase SAR1 family protein
MLAKIDKLFGCGVGELVNLPQIVVVGDQSSGKSSVLEGLISKNLPRDSGLCTRFATQIVFRRSLEENISVSILPHPGCTADHRTVAESWGRNHVESLDSETFAGIMKEACACKHPYVSLPLANALLGPRGHGGIIIWRRCDRETDFL